MKKIGTPKGAETRKSATEAEKQKKSRCKGVLELQ